MFQQSLKEISSQLRSAVDLEAHLAIDLAPSDERVQAAAFVNKRLCRALSMAISRVQQRVGGRTRLAAAKAEIRKAVLSEINAISFELIRRAKDGFEALASSPVEFSVNTANAGNASNFEAFDFQALPFISFHGEALGAALRLRGQPEGVQLEALRLAHCRWELDGFEMLDGLGAQPFPGEEGEDLHRRETIRDLHDQLKASLPSDVQEDLDTFHGCIAVGSIYPYAVPIGVPLARPREDIFFIAEAFRRIGDAFIVPFVLRLSGPRSQVINAQSAQLRYESSGVGLQVLSSWMKALDVIDESRQCSICYRHASAISRCSIHVTKTHETRVARLGRMVRPQFLDRLRRYGEMGPVKKLIRLGLPWRAEANAEMLAAAEQTSSSPITRRRAIVLANQLRNLLVVMSGGMQTEAERLFGSILTATALVEAQLPPVSLRDMRAREDQRQAAKELLSIKGFFRAWCGSGRYSPEIDLAMLGFDRDHPVVEGRALSGNDIPMLMVRQRAWTEVTEAYLASTAPSFEDVQRTLRQGHDVRAAAEQLGIALSTVYKILQRGVTPRRRHYFG